jgi:predicted transcriptional regulator
MEQIINNIQNKNNKINSFIEKIKELDNYNIDMLYHIFENIDDTFDKLENYYYLMLDKEDIIKNIQEQKQIKNIKISQQIQKTLLPYMFLMKMRLDDTI